MEDGIEMTENTLVKAIEVKKQIDKRREKETSLTDTWRLCCGNTSEVERRTFLAEVINSSGRIEKNCRISPEAMRLALDMELKNNKEEINRLVEILENMH